MINILLAFRNLIRAAYHVARLWLRMKLAGRA
jgi:hypothetical protein